MCFNPSPVRRVPSPNRYIAVAKFCFCKNNKRLIGLELFKGGDNGHVGSLRIPGTRVRVFITAGPMIKLGAHPVFS